MKLLERDSYLIELENSFNSLSNENGFVSLISGETGIGKTSLVENFVKKIEDRANVLWGSCDDLFTPRPLGPLFDIAAQLKNGLLNVLNEETSKPVIFSKFLNVLQESNLPNVVVIEDVHWADESTLDLIKYLGRRANKINSLLIVTFRDDEIDPSHPLKRVLGDFPAKDLIRIKLPPLTKKTVNNLAESYKIKNLFQITGGNPFLITELLNTKDEEIPSTIKDSILTRISHLSKEAQDLVEQVSIIPTRAEKWLIDAIFPENHEILNECSHFSILKFEDGAISFKHELSRMAVEESLIESKKINLNKKVLEILLKQEKIYDYLARITHHALKISDKKVLIKYSPLAAEQAYRLGAHSLAAEHYETALKYVEDIPLEKQLELYEGSSYECFLTGQVEKAINTSEVLIKLLKKYPAPEREAEAFRKLSRMLWYNCQDIKAEEYLNKAIEILEKLPPGEKLAMAYSNRSQTYMIREERAPAIIWGEKALSIARKINNIEIEAHALNNLGCAKMYRGDKSGEEDLKRSLEISLQNNFYEHTSRAYTNLSGILLEQRNLIEANKYFTEGIEYCNDKDLFVFSLCLAGHYSKLKLNLGNWDEAVELANSVLKDKNAPSGNRVMPLYVIGLIRARRNDPGAVNLIEEAHNKAINLGEIEKVAAVSAGRAEYYWLQNKLDTIIDDLEETYLKIIRLENPWNIGELAYWLWKGERLFTKPKIIAKPYLLQIEGNWKKAAELWNELQCPYEEALALSEGNESAMKNSIEIFEKLGASAASHLIKQKMRERGITGIPKGPRKTTKKNIAGLTDRQIEVLYLVSKGLSNIEIGKRLYISSKTVDHHISAIFSKLNIHSRYEAAEFAHSNGI